MKGSAKQVSWANEIMKGFSVETGDLVAAFRKAGQEKVMAKVKGSQDIPAFTEEVKQYVLHQDASWIIDNRNYLTLQAAYELLTKGN